MEKCSAVTASNRDDGYILACLDEEGILVSDAESGHAVEFVRLDGHAVRVTSWRPGDDPGSFTMVTITRGSRDAELLDELLAQDRLQLEICSREAISVTAREIDRRVFGEGQSGITRFAVVFGGVEGSPSEPALPRERSLDERVAALEAEVQQLRTLLGDITRFKDRVCSDCVGEG